MIQSAIPRVLSTIVKHDIKALLVGGQACILYGAAEFSRDIDMAVLLSSGNIDNLKEVMREFEAQRIYFPELSVDALQRGHACHFRCEREDLKGLRIDVMGEMRGVDPFPELWFRREEINLAGAGRIAIAGLSDLVKSKKTQRDKDWPMIRRLIEADIYNAPEDPPEPRIRFWLAECRTAELLVSLTAKYRHIASSLIDARPLLHAAIEGRIQHIHSQLREEEDKERELDRLYWLPLKAELEAWRHGKDVQST